MVCTSYYKSPIGLIKLKEENQQIVFIDFVKTNTKKLSQIKSKIILSAIKQLDEYFNGKRIKFTIPLALFGTDFQKCVWSELLKIPFGQIKTYTEIAKAIGHPRSARAVGQAMHRNPIAIIVPCHRVVGVNGLTGYAGGLSKKAWLLDHEDARVLNM